MPRQSKTHHGTLIKAKVQVAYQYLVKHEISFDLKDIFAQFDVPNRTSYRIIQDEHSLRRHRDNETRGRKRKVIEAQLDETDRILQDKDLKLKEKRYT
jgi:transposase